MVGCKQNIGMSESPPRYDPEVTITMPSVTWLYAIMAAVACVGLQESTIGNPTIEAVHLLQDKYYAALEEKARNAV